MPISLEQALAIGGGVVTATTFLATGTNWIVRKWMQKHRDELVLNLTSRVTDLQEEVEKRKKERDAERDGRKEAEGDLVGKTAGYVFEKTRASTLEAQVAQLESQLGELQEVKEALDQKQAAHDNRIRRALALEGEIWTQRVMADTPAFVPLADRRTPIVSVLNLKGGVGKTTLTAYLAWALSVRGYRVLLIDLDLQGSLSSLFLRTDELTRRAEGEPGVLQHFLNQPQGCRRPLLDFAAAVPQMNKHCRLVAATDHLAYAELSHTVRWLLRVGGTKEWNGRHDGRMILRKALHRPSLYRKFDLVLMDCPPLLNLCCSNALAASDYVLTPVTPSVKAIERVTPLLHRILQMQKQGVNPSLKPLGVVVNRTDRETLTPREQHFLFDLPRESHKVYGGPVDVFDTVVPRRSAIRDRELHFTVPDEDHPLRKTFEVLAEEFVKKLPGVCRHPDERMRKPKAKEGM